MTKKNFMGRIVLASALIVLLISGSCTGVGIFAVVAVSEKIDEGLLPEGLSARAIVNIAPDGATDDYLFFASGPGIWAKNAVTDSLWRPISLVSGGIEWDGVQSMAATNNKIYLALYDVNGDNYRVAIHIMDDFIGGSPNYRALTGAEWFSTSNSYQTLRLYCPDPTGPVYVNLMNHSGIYGSIDSDDGGFTGSTLHRFDTPNTAGDWTTLPGNRTDAASQLEMDGTNSARYVTGVADNGAGTVLVTATTNLFDSSGGILLDEDGVLVGDGSIDGSYVATTGITWIVRNFIDPVNSNLGPGAFITSATFLDGNTLPMFASDENGANWNRLSGTTTDFLTTNFVDVSDRTAGMSDGKHLVLAGTSSYIDGSTSHVGSGYNEIDVTDDDYSTWAVNTAWDNYSFALNTNYSVSDLADSTVIGMSVPDVDGSTGNYLYASSRNSGVWRIILSDDKPPWTRE